MDICMYFFGEMLEKPRTVSSDIISNGFLAGPSLHNPDRSSRSSLIPRSF